MKLPKFAANYLSGYEVLRECPREFWIIQAVNLLDAAAYFAVIFSLTVYLTDVIGIADDQSQSIAGIYLAVIAVMVFASGSIVDAIGIKRSLRTAAIFNFFGRAGLALLCYIKLDPSWMMIVLIGVLALQGFGYGFMQPVLNASIRRYTSKKSRNAGFNFWYTTMQLGAIVALFGLDILRSFAGWGGVFIMAAALNLVYLFLVMFVKSEEQVGDTTDEMKAEEKSNPLAIVWELMHTSLFWRFLLFICILIGVRMTFAFAYVVNPKYFLRVLGENALIGTISNINPILIAVGLIIFTPLLQRFKNFRLMVVGMIISCGSIFILAIPAGTREIFGWDVGQWYLTIIIIQIMIFALGEMIWSPRLQEYTANIAPRGREGAYLGWSLLPTFVSKSLVGLISGYFFVRYCPEEGLLESIKNNALDYWDSPEAMWFWLGLIVFTSPVLVGLFYPLIPKEAEKQKPEEEVSETEGDSEDNDAAPTA